ncbi:twin-arginine translocase subunit TatB [Pseudohoeflea suaedae]|uniref:Sec-independent protein translocase protein TatB n=1 Tax=Pseudohoeflea suaedae TaxID=877384 RepID=A0A4R5PRF7_9HYPH|nr:Sec-independent protein translocase protein TatB [Pseudohoeflea suaedae]TDH39187.1 twin-arginine translocase subunit TatB [Pseudohoeflea suaedae]
MLDIGWTELLVVAIVLIIVVGPKDLPPMLRAFGRTTTKLRKMANEFRGQFDEALREADLDDVRKTFSDARSLNPMNQIRDAVNPLRQTGNDIRKDLENTVKPIAVPDSGMKLDGEPKVEAGKAVEAEPLKGPVQPTEQPATHKTSAARIMKSEAAEPKAPAKGAATSKSAASKSATSKSAASKSATSKSASAKSPARKPATKATAAKSSASGTAGTRSTGAATSKPASAKTAAKTTSSKGAAKSAGGKSAGGKTSAAKAKTSRKTDDKA